MLNLIGLKGGCLGQQLSESHLMLQWSAEPLIVFVFFKKKKKGSCLWPHHANLNPTHTSQRYNLHWLRVAVEMNLISGNSLN